MSGVYRCGCDPSYAESCARCDGSAADERDLARASRWRDPGPRRVTAAEWEALLTGRPVRRVAS